MPRLLPQVGDIWLYDTSPIYSEGSGLRVREHWLVLLAGPANTVGNDADGSDYSSYYHSKDYAIQYIHMETGKCRVKIYYRKEWNELDLTGNPFYKRVA